MVVQFRKQNLSYFSIIITSSDEEIEPEVTSDEEVDSDIESSHVKLGLTESPRLTHRVTNQKTKQKHMHSKNESTKNSNEFQLDFDDGEVILYVF